MESKKLPVVYLLRTNYGDKHLIRSASEQAGWKTPGNPLAVWKLDSYPGATCEPYIPVARVRELEALMHKTMEAAYAQKHHSADTINYWLREIEEMIADVEDEHGVIEEENPQFSATSEISAHLFDAAQSLDKEGCYKSARQAAHFIKMLVREEIAAATVAQDSVHGFPERVKNYYLLPKGDK